MIRNLKGLIGLLSQCAQDTNRISPQTGPGYYAFFLKKGVELPQPFEVNEIRTLYVGIADTGGLYQRIHKNHLFSYNSSESSFRRSIGAILKDQLGLIAFPRSKKTEVIDKDLDQFRFINGGEERLTDWILENTRISAIEYNQKLGLLEWELIASLRPILNSNKWRNPLRNPFKWKLQELKEICRNEAEFNHKRKFSRI